MMEKASAVRRVLWITLLLNLLVALLTLLYGHATDSLSMVADGYHSLLDTSSNVVGLVAVAFAMRHADRGHPYGHQKIEALAAMFISGMLFLACYEVVSSAVERFRNPAVPEVTLWSFLIMIFSMAVNYGVSRYESHKGDELGSQILSADSAHSRSDVYASFSVMIALAASALHWVWMDAVGAGVITAFIAHSGYQIVRESLSTLLDSAQLEPGRIKELALQVPGVRRCHSVRTRGHPHAVYMDLNIHVDPELTTEHAHALAHAVIEKIKGKFPEVVDVMVHTEPNTRGHP